MCQCWKTRDNEAKTALVIIGVLSRADWIGGVITVDELAVLINCVHSSRNLLIKHHLAGHNYSKHKPLLLKSLILHNNCKAVDKGARKGI